MTHGYNLETLLGIADWSQPELTCVTEVFATARTPQGLWYPTTLRDIKGAASLESGASSDWYRRYYLEFDVEMPDELFSGEAVDVNNFWTQFN